uniref:Uncharacterized protein n=1 Tax=Chenopodium quinoa TaxID=63459 RepID=A0A803M7X4_CHEQI
MYGAVSKERTLLYYCSFRKNFISIRVLDPLKKMDGIETQEVSTPMEISHPPIEGHDRCETTPILTQEDPTIGIVTQASSYESTTMSLPDAPVVSPLKSTTNHKTCSSQTTLIFSSSRHSRARRKTDFQGSKTPSVITNSLFCRISGFKRRAFCSFENIWFPNRKRLYGLTPNVLVCNLFYD